MSPLKLHHRDIQLRNVFQSWTKDTSRSRENPWNRESFASRILPHLVAFGSSSSLCFRGHGFRVQLRESRRAQRQTKGKASSIMWSMPGFQSSLSSEWEEGSTVPEVSSSFGVSKSCEMTDICYRCTKENRKCIFLEAKPRPKRARKSRL